MEEVVSGGIGLAFIPFPKIISSMGAGGDLFGLLFGVKQALKPAVAPGKRIA